jgi:hypothetical protein
MFSGTILFLFCFLGSLSAQTLILNIRDSGKICTQWMNRQSNPGFYEKNRECISDVSWEYKDGHTQKRLCCQGMPLTTRAPYFPRECGKQLYTPFAQRIVGGSIAQQHSWVSLTCFFFRIV